jgi:hypothetical protein
LPAALYAAARWRCSCMMQSGISRLTRLPTL